MSYHQQQSLVVRARAFAIGAHGAINHRRKYTGDPYHVHLQGVAHLVMNVPHTDEMVAAAWLHDTVEDTKVTIADIDTEFGAHVAALVDWLSDKSKPEDGNRAARKAIDRAHIAEAPRPAKIVKLADLIDNSRTIAKYDPDFAKIYMDEKAKLLDVLVDVGRVHPLYLKARQIVDEYFINQQVLQNT